MARSAGYQLDAVMAKLNRATHARHRLVILAIGLFELFDVSAS